jgi:transcriptional regulator with XRE-family HTH domain
LHKRKKKQKEIAKKHKKIFDNQKLYCYNDSEMCKIAQKTKEVRTLSREYIELRKRIRGKYTNLKDFAAKLGITSSTLSIKLKGKSDWTRAEIESVQKLLGLTPDEVIAYFF